MGAIAPLGAILKLTLDILELQTDEKKKKILGVLNGSLSREQEPF